MIYVVYVANVIYSLLKIYFTARSSVLRPPRLRVDLKQRTSASVWRSHSRNIKDSPQEYCPRKSRTGSLPNEQLKYTIPRARTTRGASTGALPTELFAQHAPPPSQSAPKRRRVPDPSFAVGAAVAPPSSAVSPVGTVVAPLHPTMAEIQAKVCVPCPSCYRKKKHAAACLFERWTKHERKPELEVTENR
jgi:hypothetical protein